MRWAFEVRTHFELDLISLFRSAFIFVPLRLMSDINKVADIF